MGDGAVRLGGSMIVAPKSGRGLRFAFAASIGEPQLWQKAFSSLTASPHLRQLLIELDFIAAQLERTRANC